MGRSARTEATAAQVIAVVLRQTVRELRAAEAGIRLDNPTAVHEFRVVARRLRSVLKATDVLFDGGQGVGPGLRAAGRAAGAARDKEALQRVLAHALAAEPDGTTVLQLRERLEAELEGERRRAWLELVDHLDSTAYDTLVRRLDGFTDLTPWSAIASQPAVQVLLPILHDERHRFEVQTRWLSGSVAGVELDPSLHDLRKQAKSLRYISDAFVPALGRPAKAVRKDMRRLQTTLGDLRDSQLLAEFLETRLDAPELDSAQRSILQRLHTRQVATADDLRAAFLEGQRTQERLPAS